MVLSWRVREKPERNGMGETGKEQDKLRKSLEGITKEDSEQILDSMSACRLCPRECGVNRLRGQKGYCGVDASLRAARAALHFWEEPCLSGKEGSGAVFFSGCSLGCVYCQNRTIAKGWGEEISLTRLAEIFLELKDQGANNINLVTAEHFVPQAAAALRLAKRWGLSLPVVYNSGGYEKPQTLRLLEGLVDIYLPDFKYMDTGLAGRYSNAKDYPEAAKEALSEMVRQAGPCVFDERGILQKGVIVRHLVLPGHVSDSKKVVEYLYRTYGSRIYVSLMNQYTPMEAMADDPLLSRRVTAREYDRLLSFALNLGIENGYFQEGETARESFIPAFDGEGVLKKAEEENETGGKADRI